MAETAPESHGAMPDSDIGVEPAVAPPGVAGRAVFLIGAAGLLAATAVDALAVLGRHTGFSVLGSIEIVQCAVVLAASAAMIGATLQRAHASVHIFTERMAPATQRRLSRATAVLGALLFVAFAAGSIWVASDLWSGFERTELLGIPLRWFRSIWIAAALIVAGLFARQALSRDAA